MEWPSLFLCLALALLYVLPHAWLYALFFTLFHALIFSGSYVLLSCFACSMPARRAFLFPSRKRAFFSPRRLFMASRRLSTETTGLLANRRRRWPRWPLGIADLSAISLAGMYNHRCPPASLHVDEAAVPAMSRPPEATPP